MMSKANAVRQEIDERIGRKVQSASGLAVSRYLFLEFDNKPVFAVALACMMRGSKYFSGSGTFFASAARRPSPHAVNVHLLRCCDLEYYKAKVAEFSYAYARATGIRVQRSSLHAARHFSVANQLLVGI